MRPRSLVALLACAAAAAGAPGTSGGAAAPVTVKMGEYFFRPAVVKVHVGQPVRFVNVGKIAHTVADTNAHGAIRSKLIHPRELDHGDVQVVRFRSPGTVRYICTFHPTLMRGRIVVVR